MAHGCPDWGQYAPASTIYPVQDLGELAARLGSPDTFDRRGNVICFDDFESGIDQWSKDGDADYSVDWDSNCSRMGGFSCRLTTGAVTGNAVGIAKHIGFPVLSAMGVEYSFSYTQNWKYLTNKAYLFDGAWLYYAAIRYDHPNRKLQYLDSGGVYQDVVGGSYGCPAGPTDFDTLKFVADFTTAKYKRLLINGQNFDLSALGLNKVAMVITPRMYVYIELTTSADAAAIGNIDDAIITQNEP